MDNSSSLSSPLVSEATASGAIFPSVEVSSGELDLGSADLSSTSGEADRGSAAKLVEIEFTSTPGRIDPASGVISSPSDAVEDVNAVYNEMVTDYSWTADYDLRGYSTIEDIHRAAFPGMELYIPKSLHNFEDRTGYTSPQRWIDDQVSTAKRNEQKATEARLRASRKVEAVSVPVEAPTASETPSEPVTILPEPTRLAGETDDHFNHRIFLAKTAAQRAKARRKPVVQAGGTRSYSHLKVVG